MTDDQRLIEDLIPIHAINAVAQGEERGNLAEHPRRIHRWWARRPLAAARAAVFSTLVRSADVPDEARSAEYFTALCRWGASDVTIADARSQVLSSNGGVPPRVLDMFAGGGAIPLEAARLGCDAIAIELNPVAHLIEKAMLEYPQTFGPSLADDIREWGERWIDQTWERVGHLYPRLDGSGVSADCGADTLFHAGAIDDRTAAAQRVAGRPIAFAWTRSVRCPNPALGVHEAPLVHQTWLANKKGRAIALRPTVNRSALTIDWKIVHADSAEGLGFDPAGFSKRGTTTCLICGAQLDAAYIKREGVAGRMSLTPLAAVTVKASGRGREYHPVGDYMLPQDQACEAVIHRLDVEAPAELLPQELTGGMCTPYGLTRFRDLFTPRQLATLCAFAQGVRDQHAEMRSAGMEEERARAVALYLGLTTSRLAEFCTTLCVWHKRDESLQNTFRQQALPMVWDFVESNPFSVAAGSVAAYVATTATIAERQSTVESRVTVLRCSATDLPIDDGSLDAIIADPPYYDSISYADLSDFFYVWLKRALGELFPDDLTSDLTPKAREAIVAPYRHQGDRAAARGFYEDLMSQSFAEAHRVLKPGAPLVVVYAHKTTLGWSTLVDALRTARFRITEAWPLNTEMTTGVKTGTSSLATSIFLVARKRDADEVGDLNEVRGDLEALITARLSRLADAGVNGADLVIATMGAALEPYTRYASVELPNGDELPADVFLEEVQRRVLGAILKQVHGLGDGVDAVDPATRYYVLARYSYGYAPVDFDEANNLARSAGIELGDLETRHPPLLTSKRGSVALHDYSERGGDEELGLSDGDPNRSLIDVLHGLLWRSVNNPREIKAYLDATRPDPVALRLVAQALQGRALRGEENGASKHPEQQACERLLGAWNTLVDDNLLAP